MERLFLKPSLCFSLATAPWEANTRYEIVLSAKNPRPSAGPGNGALKLWMAPFSYSRLEYEQLGFKCMRTPLHKSQPPLFDLPSFWWLSKRMMPAVRGPRYGTVCSTREGAGGQGSLEPEFFDACTAAGGESLPLPENAIPMECVDALNRNLAANPNRVCCQPRELQLTSLFAHTPSRLSLHC